LKVVIMHSIIWGKEGGIFPSKGSNIDGEILVVL